MSAEKHHIEYVPESPGVGTAFVAWSAFATLLLLVLAIGGLYGVYRAAVPAGMLPAPQTFPKPRVDTTESQELRRIRDAQSAKLKSWGWADDRHTLVQMPIDRAMQLLARKGNSAYESLLPPQAASSPTAAAERATTEPGQAPAASTPGPQATQSAGPKP